jgi:hypothetical protein
MLFARLTKGARPAIAALGIMGGVLLLAGAERFPTDVFAQAPGGIPSTVPSTVATTVSNNTAVSTATQPSRTTAVQQPVALPRTGAGLTADTSVTLGMAALAGAAALALLTAIGGVARRAAGVRVRGR